MENGFRTGSFRDEMFKNVKTIEVQRFSNKWEATGKQSGYINSLCRKVGCTLEQAIEAMFGMPCVSAFSDRPFLRLTRREASSLIDLLKAEEARQTHHKAALTDEGPTDEQVAKAWQARQSVAYDAAVALPGDEIEQERRISCDDCPF
jgi:hypothetical protein